MNGAGAARGAEKRAFLAAAGWGGARLAPLAGDASSRRYDRVALGGRRAVLMDAPPEDGSTGRFAAVTAILRARGFSAPEILAAHLPRGLMLLEDLGDALFARVCAGSPERESQLYAAAADLLAELHAAPPPRRGGDAVPPYDAGILWTEARRLIDWWLPAATGRATPPDLAAEFRALVESACARVAGDRSALVLRDYHAENLVWLPERTGVARVGLLDYQDALTGSPAYDLASLVEDARRDVAPALREAVVARYADATGADRGALESDLAALAAQRNLKIVGLFARLRLRDGKPQYLDLLPRVWAHLMRDLAHADMAELRLFVSRRVPAPTPETLALLRSAPPAVRAVAGLGAPDAAPGGGAAGFGDGEGIAEGVRDGRKRSRAVARGAPRGGRAGAARSLGRRGSGGGPMSAPGVAMVMAAGLGTRMGALTASRPKPLLEAGGRALLDHALDRVAEAGVRRAVVNVHYLAGQVRAHLAARVSPQIAVSDESDRLMETGGGIRRALPLLGPGPVFALNSDALWTGPAPLPRLAEAWDPARMDALLLLVRREDAVEHAGAGDFLMDADGRLERRGGRPEAPYVYTGAQIIRLEPFADAPDAPFSTNLVWDRMLADGRLFGVAHAGGWIDVGTPQGLETANRMAADGAAR